MMYRLTALSTSRRAISWRVASHARPFAASSPLRATPRDPVDEKAGEHSEQSPHLHHKAGHEPDTGAGNTAEQPTLPSQENETDHYAKDDHEVDPVPQGTTTYVVSHPEHADTPYDVPSGAFPTSSPYKELEPAPSPESQGAPSSTSSAAAHPVTTARADKVDDEHPFGSSSAVRHTEAPGDMAQGSDGGLGLQEGVKVQKGEEPGLASRNAWPDEEQGKKGLKDAWKDRK